MTLAVGIVGIGNTYDEGDDDDEGVEDSGQINGMD